jgi:hypothetical protein
MDPAQAVRFSNRTTAERVNSNLKDNYGGRFVRVGGAAKVKDYGPSKIADIRMQYELSGIFR